VESCDVLIVGGGPAGSTCASRLRAAGLDVLVLDKAVFPRSKPCAGWITPSVFETLGLSAAEYAGGRTLQPFTGFRTGWIGGLSRETHFDRPVSFGILRTEFDQYLLRRSGARFRDGSPVAKLRRVPGGWVVNEAIRTPLLVGAGGHFCPVAREVHKARTDRPIVALELEFPLEGRAASACRVRPEVPQLYFRRDLAGYGWCLRKGRYLNVGVGSRHRCGLPGEVREFVAFLHANGEVPFALPSRWRGHAYRLYEGPRRRRADDGVLLAGDAAGLAVAVSGEGIRPAIESGRLAAATILRAAGRYRREDLESYDEAIASRCGRPPRRRGPASPLVSALASRLLATGWFTRRVLLGRWFLQSHLPSLSV